MGRGSGFHRLLSESNLECGGGLWGSTTLSKYANSRQNHLDHNLLLDDMRRLSKRCRRPHQQQATRSAAPRSVARFCSRICGTGTARTVRCAKRTVTPKTEKEGHGMDNKKTQAMTSGVRDHSCDSSPTDFVSSSLKWWSSMHGVDTCRVVVQSCLPTHNIAPHTFFA